MYMYIHVGSASVSLSRSVLKQPWRQATFPVAVARDPATPAFDANHFAASQSRSIHFFSTKTQLPICCLYQLNFACGALSLPAYFSLCFLLTKLSLSFFLSNRRSPGFAARSSSPSGDSFAPTPAPVVRPYSPSYLSLFFSIFFSFL